MKATCPGFTISTGSSGELLCLDSLGAPVAWEVQPEFDVSQLESEDLAGAWAAGFVLVGTAWAIGYGFRSVLRMIGR
ncbi:MAG TPA: hypothetical protein VK652_01410 [Steroidobacteraceae bacterium]|nr:hypothetical protein [Steroidobacteraceae bacterium]